MTPFVTVMLKICVSTALQLGCTFIPITDNTQGQDDNQVVNMTGCLGTQGFLTAQKYWNDHPDMHDHFQFAGWACKLGNKKAPDQGHA